MNAAVIVVGGSGCTGSYRVRTLSRLGYRVVTLDYLRTGMRLWPKISSGVT